MKKKNKKSKGWFEDRRVALLVALILAVLSWILVAGFINPGDTRRLTPITIDYSRNADMYEARNLRIVGEPTPRYAEVQVSGDGSVIGPLTTTSVTVYPDYSAVTGPGPQELRLLYEKVDFGDYNITEVSAIATGYSLDSNPKHTVTLVFEELETKEFPIAVKADNVTAADGFFRDTPTADPARVTIDGAKTELDRIAQVVAVLEDDVELTETTSYQDVPLTLMDSAGNVLDTAAMNLNFSITSTTVTVPIMVSKSIQLTATFIGLPSYFDTDWFYERVQLTPDTLQVVGSASAFEHIGDTVSVATFDASTLTPGWQSEPQEIELPEGSGLSYHDQQREIIVSFDTTGMIEKVFEVEAENISVKNGPRSATITPDMQTMSVKLFGPADEINSLLPEDIALEIDASGVPASNDQQTIPAKVVVPSATHTIPTGNYSVLCSIEMN
ncbi:MAG: hypothetical protein GXY32_08950 [Ruminococcaceae bacterium]|nr:hypothetical protein [Oscillospiraceae bacterium]